MATTVLSIENNTLFRTDASTPLMLAEGNYLPAGRFMLRDESVSYQARCLFQFLHTFDADVHPTRRELAKLTSTGQTKVGKLLKELVAVGWIRLHSMTINGAKAQRIDLFGPHYKSIPDEIATGAGQSQTGSTPTAVDPIQDQPDQQNPCAPTVSTPLIEADIKYKNPKERKESPSPSLVGVVGFSPKAEKTPNWVRIAKLIEESFTYDADFVFGVLNPFVKAASIAGHDRTLLIFAEWLDHYRDDHYQGKQLPASKRNLGRLWIDFEAGGKQLERRMG